MSLLSGCLRYFLPLSSTTPSSFSLYLIIDGPTVQISLDFCHLSQIYVVRDRNMIVHEVLYFARNADLQYKVYLSPFSG